jgi:uncharacterized protein
MKFPCELVVWNVLPSIRAAVAVEMVNRGMLQNEISKLLGITPPAVSQYVSKKRGYSIEFGEEVKLSISKLAEDLMDNRLDDPMDRICEICKMLREDETADDHQACRI